MKTMLADEPWVAVEAPAVKTKKVMATITETCTYSMEMEIDEDLNLEEERDQIDAIWTNVEKIDDHFDSCDERDYEWDFTMEDV